MTRSINDSVDLSEGLLDDDASGSVIMVAAKSGSSSGNSASISAGSSSRIRKESVNSISMGGKGGMLSSSNIESPDGMGADPSGAAAGFVTGLSSCVLAMPGIGAEPSAAVGGL